MTFKDSRDHLQAKRYALADIKGFRETYTPALSFDQRKHVDSVIESLGRQVKGLEKVAKKDAT